MSFVSLSTLKFFGGWTCRGDHKTFLLFGFCRETPPLLLKLVVVDYRILVGGVRTKGLETWLDNFQTAINLFHLT